MANFSQVFIMTKHSFFESEDIKNRYISYSTKSKKKVLYPLSQKYKPNKEKLVTRWITEWVSDWWTNNNSHVLNYRRPCLTICLTSSSWSRVCMLENWLRSPTSTSSTSILDIHSFIHSFIYWFIDIHLSINPSIHP